MPRKPTSNCLAPLTALLGGLLAMTASLPAPGAPRPTSADDLLVVNCLLPGQIRQLGRHSTYVSPRRPVKTTALDCRVRGGEYVVGDRADYRSALNVWLEKAREGDPEAQTTVGEIFEQGMGIEPDYAAAARWYARAAKQGYARAQISLGYLYEKGLGVEADARTALEWYRRAAGLEAEVDLEPHPDVSPAATEPSPVVAELSQRVRDQQVALETLRRELDDRSRELADARTRLAAAYTGLEETRATLQAQNATLADLEAKRNALADARDREAATAAGSQAEILALKEKIARQQTLLAEREQTVASLETVVADLRARPSPEPVAAAPIREGLVAGPSITLVDPTLGVTRGLVKVTVPTSPSGPRVIGRVSAPAGLLSLTINRSPASVNPAGVFTYDLPATDRPVEVAITAIDQQGKRSDLAFTVAPPGTAGGSDSTEPAPAPPPVDFGRYHALLIGNTRHASLPELKTPGNDVKRLNRILTTRYGFRTRVLENATRFEILSALNDYRERLTSDDNLLVYYAGHGVLEDRNQRGYWLPVDAEEGNSANWISNVTVTDIFNIMNAKQILLIADSCYSGSLTRSSIPRLRGGLTEAERLNWLRTMARKRSRVVLTSGGLAPVLDGGGGKHSVFARALLEVLEANQDVLEGQSLYQALAARVAYAAANIDFEQNPQYAPMKRAGHEAGDFFLAPRG